MTLLVVVVISFLFDTFYGRGSWFVDSTGCLPVEVIRPLAEGSGYRNLKRTIKAYDEGSDCSDDRANTNGRKVSS